MIFLGGLVHPMSRMALYPNHDIYLRMHIPAQKSAVHAYTFAGIRRSDPRIIGRQTTYSRILLAATMAQPDSDSPRTKPYRLPVAEILQSLKESTQ